MKVIINNNERLSMKVIHSKKFPYFSNYINILGKVYTKVRLLPYEINNEKIHSLQIKELYYIGYYILFVIEYLIKLLFAFNFKRAYNKVSFVKERIEKQRDYNYAKCRTKYSWIKYIC